MVRSVLSDVVKVIILGEGAQGDRLFRIPPDAIISVGDASFDRSQRKHDFAFRSLPVTWTIITLIDN